MGFLVFSLKMVPRRGTENGAKIYSEMDPELDHSDSGSEESEAPHLQASVATHSAEGAGMAVVPGEEGYHTLEIVRESPEIVF